MSRLGCERSALDCVRLLVAKLLPDRDPFVGSYAHGSVAMGDFVPGVSDLDIIVVSRASLKADHLAEIACRFRDCTTDACCATRVVVGIYTSRTVQNIPKRPAYELMMTRTGAAMDVLRGDMEPGQEEFAIHFEICRQFGIPVFGPAPGGVFAPVPRKFLLQAFSAVLAWLARNNPRPEETVLNACRIWRYALDGALGSKVAGHAWAARRLDDRSLIDLALDRHLRRSRSQPGTAAAWAFSDFVRDQVEREIADCG